MSTAATCCEYHRGGGNPAHTCKRHSYPADPEIDALETCLLALLPLEPAARSRVLEYLDDRLQRADAEAVPQ